MNLFDMAAKAENSAWAGRTIALAWGPALVLLFGACSRAVDSEPQGTSTLAAGGSGGATSEVAPGDDNLNIGGAQATQPRTPPVHLTFTSGEVPENVAELFSSAENGSETGPTLAYPTPETMFPPNMERLLFQFSQAEESYLHLHLETVGTTDETGSSLDIYTDGQSDECAMGSASEKCFQATAEVLQPFGMAAAGYSVALTVSALDAATPTKRKTSAPIEFIFAPTPVTGAIYYWSTREQGIRHTTLNSKEPQNYVVPDTFSTLEKPAENCVACHTLSRSGKYMAFAFPGERLGVISVTETLPPPLSVAPPDIKDDGQFVSASWSAFSPDDEHLLVTGQGALSIVNREGGALVSSIQLPENSFGSMPDWSPQGDRIAFAWHQDPDLGRRVRHLVGSSISLMNGSGTSFSNSQVRFAPSSATETLSYPMFDPSGAYIAYARADHSSEEDVSSEIWVGPVDEGASLPLTRANEELADGLHPKELMNNMPTWAPSGDSSIAWIAFSTKRSYGLVEKTASHKQLWIAAIDLTKLGDGDASFPAFRLTGQDLEEDNHRPFWAVDVLPPDWKPPIVK